MQRKLPYIGALVAGFLFFFALAPQLLQAADEVLVPGNSLGKVKLGMSDSELQAILGKATKEDSGALDRWNYLSKDKSKLIQFHLKKDKIEQIIFNSESFKLANGEGIAKLKAEVSLTGKLGSPQKFEKLTDLIRYTKVEDGFSLIVWLSTPLSDWCESAVGVLHAKGQEFNKEDLKAALIDFEASEKIAKELRSEEMHFGEDEVKLNVPLLGIWTLVVDEEQKIAQKKQKKESPGPFTLKMKVKNDAGKEIQEIPIEIDTKVYSWVSLASALVIEDYNFDGFADFSFVDSLGASGNGGSAFYFFNSKKKRFDKSEIALTNFTVDRAKKELKSATKCGGTCFSGETIRFYMGTPYKAESFVFEDPESAEQAGNITMGLKEKLKAGYWVENRKIYNFAKALVQTCIIARKDEPAESYLLKGSEKYCPINRD
jgi:hypothetical protein